MRRSLRRICLTGLLCGFFGATAATAGPLGAIGSGDVWQLPPGAWTACLQSGDDASGCLRRIMTREQASPRALAINRQLDGEGYMAAFHEAGRVDVATMEFPLRANSNEVAYLVNGQPGLVSSELDETALPLAANPDYRALHNQYPDLMFWPVGDGPREVTALAQGGQGFVFSYALLNGCHACEVLGQAVVSLDFNARGRFLGPRLVRVESER